MSQRCDGRYDCQSGIDEAQCPETESQKKSMKREVFVVVGLFFFCLFLNSWQFRLLTRERVLFNRALELDLDLIPCVSHSQTVRGKSV